METLKTLAANEAQQTIASVLAHQVSLCLRAIDDEINRLKAIKDNPFSDLVNRLEKLKEDCRDTKESAGTHYQLLQLGCKVVRHTAQCIKSDGSIEFPRGAETGQRILATKGELVERAAKFEHRHNKLLRGIAAFFVGLYSYYHRQRYGRSPFFLTGETRSQHCAKELATSFETTMLSKPTLVC